MSRLYKTQGVILSHYYVGEADALLSICTPFLGKLRAVARGVKRSKSRMAGHLEPQEAVLDGSQSPAHLV